MVLLAGLMSPVTGLTVILVVAVSPGINGKPIVEGRDSHTSINLLLLGAIAVRFQVSVLPATVVGIREVMLPGYEVGIKLYLGL